MKDKLQTGDIILQKGGGLIGNIIKWKTKCPYTHCGIYLGNGLMAEAYWKGVVIHPIYDYAKGQVDYFRFEKELNDTEKKYILRNAYKYEGTQYDFLHVFLNLFRGGLCWLPYDSNFKVYCFEFVARVFEESGLSLNDGTLEKWDLDYITGYELSHTQKLRRLKI